MRIKCRYCTWVTSTNIGSGGADTAFRRLRSHIADAHPDVDDEMVAAAEESKAFERQLIEEMWGS